jgi:cytochrome c-type biogenesis protein CcmF
MGGAIFLMLLVSGGLLVWRLPMLRAPKADALGHGWFGQRALAVLMIALTGAVLWGTMYPLFLRVLRNQEISVTPEFFRAVCTPLGVAVLAIFAVSPLLPGQQAANVRREAIVRGVIGAVSFIGFYALTGWHNPGVALVLAVSVLAFISVARKLGTRVGSAWSSSADSKLLAALRASGPYVAHVGLIMMLAAVTLNANLQQEGRVTLKVGETATVGGQTVKVLDIQAAKLTESTAFVATVALIGNDGGTIAVVSTEQDQFTSTGETHAEVGIHVRPTEDIYIVLEAADTSTKEVTLNVFTNPAVLWIWMGGLIMAIGGILFALPKRIGAPPMALETVHDQDRELVGA